MTAPYDPSDPSYRDEKSVRDELTRVYDVCNGCRRCATLCSSFPTLFDMLDQSGAGEAGRLTPAQQDRVVDACFGCKLCHLDCPYTPDLDELGIDVPRLMLRAGAMRHSAGQRSFRGRVAARFVGRTDTIGRLATKAPVLANNTIAAREGSLVRTLVGLLTGLSTVRRVPRYAAQRFSDWFETRTSNRDGAPQRKVTVFPTCLVEYQATQIGKDLVAVYERNGIECSITEAGCCGAPSLHAGDVDRFTASARGNVGILADEIRRGRDIVVPQPMCSYVLKFDYAEYVGGPDADLVAKYSYDAVDYLLGLERSDDTHLDTDFVDAATGTITYLAADHVRAQRIGLPARDLLELGGAEVDVVEECSGMSGMWGFRADNDEIATPLVERLGELVATAGGAVVAGDCNLANTAIAERTGSAPSHPLQVIARAYGIAEEP